MPAIDHRNGRVEGWHAGEDRGLGPLSLALKKTASIVYTLPNFMLQGGRNGPHHYVDGAGAVAQFNLVSYIMLLDIK
jgi:hypothetical protein